jgi:hypothetical protein
MLIAISQLFSVIERQHHQSRSGSVLARCRRLRAIFTVLDFVRGLADSTQMKWILAGSFLAFAGCSAMKESEAIVTFRRSTPEIAINSKNIELSVGDSAVVEIWARPRANHTGILVKKGSKYSFVVPPGQIWTDWFVRTNAEGYPHGPLSFIQEAFRSTKPLPNKNWFLLIGAIDRPERAPFSIGGTRVVRRMTCSGELVLFANDAKAFYWNNFGRIQVIITRVL